MVAGKDRGTSISIGYVGESYIDFGYVGMFLRILGLGYAFGTYFGICLEEKISFGYIRLRIITKKNLTKMIEDLRPTKYVFISDSVNSSHGKIKIINAFLERKHLKKVIKRIKTRDPNAFYTIEDLKMIKEEPKEKRHFFITNKFK